MQQVRIIRRVRTRGTDCLTTQKSLTTDSQVYLERVDLLSVWRLSLWTFAGTVPEHNYLVRESDTTVCAAHR